MLDETALLLLPLAPFWDLCAFVVWLFALAGHDVEWRGQRFRLTKDGVLEPLPDTPSNPAKTA